MGTNFYLKIPIHKREKEKIIELVNEDKFEDLVEYVNELYKTNDIHLGKRSAGWQFLWDYHNGLYYKPELESIKEFLKKGNIYNEYGEKFTIDQFFKEELYGCLYKDEHHWDLETYQKEHPDEYHWSVDKYEFISEEGLRFSKNEDFS